VWRVFDTGFFKCENKDSFSKNESNDSALTEALKKQKNEIDKSYRSLRSFENRVNWSLLNCFAKLLAFKWSMAKKQMPVIIYYFWFRFSQQLNCSNCGDTKHWNCVRTFSNYFTKECNLKTSALKKSMHSFKNHFPLSYYCSLIGKRFKFTRLSACVSFVGPQTA